MADCITKYGIDKNLTLARHYQTGFPKNTLILSVNSQTASFASKTAPVDMVDKVDEMD
ncbi:hypothetical protein [Bartonella sp. B39]